MPTINRAITSATRFSPPDPQPDIKAVTVAYNAFCKRHGLDANAKRRFNPKPTPNPKSAATLDKERREREAQDYIDLDALEE